MWRYLAALLTGLALASCGGGSDGEPAATGAPSSTPSTAALFGPVGLAQAADGQVWAAWSQSDAVAPVRADGTAGKPVAVGRTPLRLVELDGMLWVTTIRDGGLSQVDPAGSTVVRTVNLGEQPEGLAALDGHLFVVLQEGAALVEVDPADGARVRRYDVGGEPRMVAAGDGALYVGDFAGGRVVRVQPGAPGRVRASRAVCAGVQDLIVLGGTVWAACMTDNRVVGLDPRTLAVTHRIDVPRDPDGLAAGAGNTLVVSQQDGPGIAVVDTTSGAVRHVFTGTSGRLGDKANNDVLEREGTAFLSDYTGNRVEMVRLDAS
jgi:streptogramin lyase